MIERGKLALDLKINSVMNLSNHIPLLDEY